MIYKSAEILNGFGTHKIWTVIPALRIDHNRNCPESAVLPVAGVTRVPVALTDVAVGSARPRRCVRGPVTRNQLRALAPQRRPVPSLQEAKIATPAQWVERDSRALSPLDAQLLAPLQGNTVIVDE